MTLHLKPAGQALRDQLADLDANMGLLDGGEMPVEQARAILALAQVKATAALVHAVRELTEAVRARR